MKSTIRYRVKATLGGLLCCAAVGMPAMALATDTAVAPTVSGTQYTLRHSEGAPQAIRLDGDGMQLWEYTATRSRPAMEVRFDRDSRVAGARWLRGSADFAQVAAQRLGMPQTLALLGQPESVAVTAEGVVWRYRKAEGGAAVVRFGADSRALGVE
jgi:hypothetical protein